MSSELDGDSVRWRVGEGSRAFLLRCWQEPERGSGRVPSWRFSVTHINATQEQKGFTDLEAVMAYINKILTAGNDLTSKGEQS